MSLCQECSRKKSPLHDVLCFESKDLCVKCFNLRYNQIPLFGEKRERAYDRAHSFLTGYQRGVRRDRGLWILLGVVGASAVISLLDLIGGWLG